MAGSGQEAGLGLVGLLGLLVSVGIVSLMNFILTQALPTGAVAALDWVIMAEGLAFSVVIGLVATRGINAVSVASMILTTEAIVTDSPEEIDSRTGTTASLENSESGKSTESWSMLPFWSFSWER